MNEPEQKMLIMPVWDLETDEIIEMEIPEDFWQELKQAEREQEERYQRALEEERDAWLYARDE